MCVRTPIRISSGATRRRHRFSSSFRLFPYRLSDLVGQLRDVDIGHRYLCCRRRGRRVIKVGRACDGRTDDISIRFWVGSARFRRRFRSQNWHPWSISSSSSSSSSGGILLQQFRLFLETGSGNFIIHFVNIFVILALAIGGLFEEVFAHGLIFHLPRLQTQHTDHKNTCDVACQDVNLMLSPHVS
jgi:hypothetical protein